MLEHWVAWYCVDLLQGILQHEFLHAVVLACSEDMGLLSSSLTFLIVSYPSLTMVCKHWWLCDIDVSFVAQHSTDTKKTILKAFSLIWKPMWALTQWIENILILSLSLLTLENSDNYCIIICVKAIKPNLLMTVRYNLSSKESVFNK